VNPASAEGWLLVFRDQIPQAAAPDHRESLRAAQETGESQSQPETGAWIPEGKALAEVRIGPTGYRLLAGMYQAIAALARAGNHVIVDDVIYDQRVLKAAVEALHPLPVLFVGVRCPLDVVMRRERERGDRGPGGAAAFYHLVHAHERYDLEVDTSRASAVECARRIKQALEDDCPRTALRQLKERIDEYDLPRATWRKPGKHHKGVLL
jgi:chloramphenicol 3-O phosphotransferase